MVDVLMVTLLTDNEFDAVTGGRGHGGGGGGGGGGVRPANNNIRITVIQNALGGFGGNFSVSASSLTTLTGVGNTGNVSTITLTF